MKSLMTFLFQNKKKWIFDDDDTDGDELEDVEWWPLGSHFICGLQ